MKIVVDFDLCEANGLCVGAAPDVFELNDDDELIVLIKSPDAARRGELEQAAELCPRAAISIEED